ncbi:hypothetical protein CC86DRAFT_415864, partial [Ophiobolus disseminans]
SARDAAFANILVGPKQVKFIVHENLLVQYSEFFRAALTGKFKEAEEKTVKLEEDDTTTFELFVHWLYYQRFPNKAHGDHNELIKLYHDDLDCGTNSCIQLHVFGDKYGVKRLKEDSLDELINITLSGNNHCLTDADDVKLAFEHLPERSPMCRLIIDSHCLYGDPRRYQAFAAYTCIPFLHGVWLRHSDLLMKSEEEDQVQSPDITRCDYHEHENDEEKEACKKKQKRARASVRAQVKVSDFESESETER